MTRSPASTALLVLLLPTCVVLTAATKPKKLGPAKSFVSTYANPAGPSRADDPMKIKLNEQTPVNPEHYTFKASLAKNAKATQIPVYIIDEFARPRVIGSMAPDAPVKLVGQVATAGQVYFDIDDTAFSRINTAAEPPKGTRFWVSGFNITPATYTPPAR